VARPGNGTRDGGEITDKRRRLAAFAVKVLNLADLIGVVVEQKSVLLLEVVAEVLTLQDTVELTEKLEGVLNVGDVLKVCINVVLELSLNSGDIGLELDEIAIESVVVKFKKLVVLLLETGNG
jgi:DNA polymerase III gamma/tau subunit